MKARKTKRFLTILVGVLFLLTMVPLVGHAEVPQSINYQGYLTDSDGNPVPDDDYLIGFSIYDQPTGGAPLWSESQTLAVTSGVYNVILGQPGNPLDPDDFDGDLYLGVIVGTDDEMQPRQKLTSVGYAFRAAIADEVADGGVSTVMIQDGAVTETKISDDSVTSGKIADGAVTATILHDGAALSEILDDDGAGSGLDADLLDGYHGSSYTRITQDYGRSGVATNLYEGTSTLNSKYVNESGDSMTGTLTINSASGYGLYGKGSSYGVKGEFGGTSYAAGVLGNTTGGVGDGVQGLSDGRSGVWGRGSGTGSYGVYGKATGTSGHGIHGVADNSGDVENYGGWFQASGQDGRGVYGYASNSGTTTNYGGYFEAAGTTARAVRGSATNSGDVYNYGGHFQASGKYGRGVYGYASDSGEGSGTNYGVYGYARGNTGRAVYGYASGTDAYGGYFYAYNTNSIGIYAYGGPSGWAADFRGNVRIRDRSTGNTVMELGKGLDYAEGFDVSDLATIDPGSVLIIDPDNPGKLALSKMPYDTKVAGIAAGANGLGSGVRLGGEEFDQDVALAGRVYCNVDATEVGVEPGDMLTTSSTPGYAMKSTDYMRAHGAILGKAMQRLEKGQKGQILVLVTLQ